MQFSINFKNIIMAQTSGWIDGKIQSTKQFGFIESVPSTEFGIRLGSTTALMSRASKHFNHEPHLYTCRKINWIIFYHKINWIIFLIIKSTEFDTHHFSIRYFPCAIYHCIFLCSFQSVLKIIIMVQASAEYTYLSDSVNKALRLH
jgi:hypothetical protein